MILGIPCMTWDCAGDVMRVICGQIKHVQPERLCCSSASSELEAAAEGRMRALDAG
jgi:hypothetical protein